MDEILLVKKRGTLTHRRDKQLSELYPILVVLLIISKGAQYNEYLLYCAPLLFTKKDRLKA
ncbi:MAG TPA: hypothetical protein DDY58_17620 [Terrisporobacter glycolicus]|nr:hypothetical protein [Terrisporobacter hibernicus]